jgi:drug/metabolite transporter (DMT)-like permease
MNLFTGGALQCCVCGLAMSAGMTIFDEGPVHWTAAFMVAWFWMAIAVSIGAVSILYIMIRRAEVSRVTSVFFLMPVSAAVIAYALFGQALTASAFLGMGVTVAGVMLAQRR